MYHLLRPLIFLLDSEKAHDLAILSAKYMGKIGFLRALISFFAQSGLEQEDLRAEAFGLTFKNPIGLAAGFDKQAAAIQLLHALGFGHVEIGTVTPKPQIGNPKPRIFRLPSDNALINRMGFPSKGADAALEELEKLDSASKRYIGANIGKNKDTPSAKAAYDYEHVAKLLAPHVSWITVNVSSPNTPGLRNLQAVDALQEIVAAVTESIPEQMPVLVKLSPDLSRKDLEEILNLLVEKKVSGVIASNTTLSREGLSADQHSAVKERGGLSGKPLFTRTKETVSFIKDQIGDSLDIIAVGGVSNGSQCKELLDAGAKLVQVYTALVYEGPFLCRKILRDLS